MVGVILALALLAIPLAGSVGSRAATALAPAAGVAREAALEIDSPHQVVAGAGFRVRVRAFGAAAGGPVELHMRIDGDAAGPVLAVQTDSHGMASFDEVTAPRSGQATLEVSAPGVRRQVSIGVWSGFLSVIPPLVAIALAIAFRQVLIALVAGIWIGATFLSGFNPFQAGLRVLDRYLLDTFTDSDHASIILFTMLLGGLVAIVSRSGGMQGIVDVARRWASGRRSTQVVTWLLGLFIFFDDYTNTLIVGNTMRPVTDRMKISREKLAYLVDSTSAPIASIAVISTWIGFEVGLIGDALRDIGSDLDPYQVFLASIPYRFYPILALVFAAAVALSRRDFGPMLAAERRAAAGKLLADTATPMTNFETGSLTAKEDCPHRWINAALPIGTIIGVTLIGLWVTGRAALAAEGQAEGLLPAWRVLAGGHPLETVGKIFSAAESFKTLMWGAGLGCVVAATLAITQKILSVREALDTWLAGLKSMLLAVIILLLAWSIGAVCADLHTANYLVGLVSGTIPWALLPAMVFVISGAVSFATGTSWATMAILVPLTVPLAKEIAVLNAFPADHTHLLLLGALSSVLAGATWGDHCSPISDTTIMSSMASGSDHIDHVRTQLPYAMLVGAVGLIVGDIPTALGLSPWLSLALGTGILLAILRLVGRPVETQPPGTVSLTPRHP